jgi:hypothetical protein
VADTQLKKREKAERYFFVHDSGNKEQERGLLWI